MDITPLSSDIKVYIPRNERTNALKIKEIMPEAEFTGLSADVRVDGSGSRWFGNNDTYTKTFGKYDAYAYEWTVGTGKDIRSSYSDSHPTEGMGFEDFLGYVRENGLDRELNENAINSDIKFFYKTDHTTLSQQADFLAAYCAQLEDHVNRNFSGDERDAQLNIINSTVGRVINEVADSYAKDLSSVLGGAEYENIRSSVSELINGRINSYREIIRSDPDFAKLEGTEDEWLKGSHRFMSSELQKAFAASGIPEKSTGCYSENDLIYLGKIASSLTVPEGVRRVADEETIGFSLGTVMVRSLALGRAMGVSGRAAATAENAVNEFRKKFMDTVDGEMDRRRAHSINSRERNGYEHLDRNETMAVALKMQTEYENTRSLMKALLKGMSEGYNSHVKKLSSGLYGDKLRYAESNCNFWRDMYSASNGKESISEKIEKDELLFEYSLDKNDINADLMFSHLGTGYLTFGEYNIPVQGKTVTELPGRQI